MDQTGTETQRQQLHPSQVGQAADKSGYRLFPVADQRQQVSPKTLQKQTLGRAGSISKRRSVSLDDASRRDVLTRTPFARTGNNPVPRIQAVPPNRSKITKAYGNNTSSRAPHILPYKPRVSDDGGHGRSSSAPGDIVREGSSERHPNGRAPVANAALLKAPKPLHGPGETWYDDKSRDSVVESKHERRHRLRSSALDDKPLPPPPQSSDGRAYLDVSHGRSQSTPLSPTPGSGFPAGLRSDSVTDLVPLVTPSSLDPNRKSYFPLSKDAQMRRLMGMSPIEDVENDFAAFQARQKAVIAQNPVPPLTLPASRYQKALPALVIPEKKDSTPPARKQAEFPKAVPAPKDLKAEAPVAAEDKNLTPPSPTFSQASRSLKPAALKIGGPKRSVSVSSSLDRRTHQARTHIAREVQKIKPLVQKPTPKVDPMATVIASVLDLTEEMDALCTRYASLREARQDLSAAITQGLREQKPGPEYVNTLLDQHMSLSTICSSMDICLAKIKALNRRKDSLLTSGQSQAKASLSSIDEAKPAPIPSSTKPPASTPPPDTTILQNTVYVPPLRTHRSTEALSRQTPMSAPTQHTKRFDREYDTSDSDTPRRLNVKGAKAAKILGLEIDTPPNDPAKPSDPFAQRPTQLSSKANLSTTSLDRDLFTRNPSPAPERPLPARPSLRQRKPSPTPLDTSTDSNKNNNNTTTTTITTNTTPPNPAHAAQNSIGTSSSRASSPAEDRGAETPQDFPPPHQSAAFDDAKSPSMQTVHVYFPEGEAMGLGMPTRTMMKSSRVASSTYSSTFSEIGEDELLEYYGYLN